MAKHKFKLGTRVRDICNGFIGIALARHEYLNGCVQYSVEPPVDRDNKYSDALRIDEGQLEKVDDGILEKKPKPKRDGGPSVREPKS